MFKVFKTIEILESSILENLCYSLKTIPELKLNKILEVVDLESTCQHFKEGLNTHLNYLGEPFWPGQLVRMQLARLILHLKKNEILILTSIFDSVEPKRRKKILNYLTENEITFIYISADQFNLNSKMIDHFNDAYTMNRAQLIPYNDKEELNL